MPVAKSILQILGFSLSLRSQFARVHALCEAILAAHIECAWPIWDGSQNLRNQFWAAHKFCEASFDQLKICGANLGLLTFCEKPISGCVRFWRIRLTLSAGVGFFKGTWGLSEPAVPMGAQNGCLIMAVLFLKGKWINFKSRVGDPVYDTQGS